MKRNLSSSNETTLAARMSTVTRGVLRSIIPVQMNELKGRSTPQCARHRISFRTIQHSSAKAQQAHLVEGTMERTEQLAKASALRVNEHTLSPRCTAWQSERYRTEKECE